MMVYRKANCKMLTVLLVKGYSKFSTAYFPRLSVLASPIVTNVPSKVMSLVIYHITMFVM